MHLNVERACPVCGTGSAAASLFLEASIDPARLSPSSYASRKQPEFMSHRLVRCPSCGLVYVPNPPAQETLAQAYHEAAYDSAQEAEDAAHSYMRAIDPVLRRIGTGRSALEIGTGTGVFLAQLERAGYRELVGVEPSVAAIEAAPSNRRAWIRQGIFCESDFEPASFDLICCFMTMEHVADPGGIATAAWRLLRPGGAFVTVTHDYQSLVNRLLGRHSPIVDLEHMQLFCDSSLHALFARGGYQEIDSRVFVNRYALGYWLRLAPLPQSAKPAIARLLDLAGLARIKLGFNVGNTLCAGYKPR